ncbi:MAG: potassium channel family protein [Verrucomicrobiota bacterium]
MTLAQASSGGDTSLLLVIAIGGGLTASNVMVHAVGSAILIQWVPGLAHRWMARAKHWGAIGILLLVASGMLLLHIIEVVIWALAYLFLTPITQIPDFETALYFSGSTYTTVGYGDITLETDWRLLTSFEAMAGMLLLGWSTALLFATLREILRKLGHETKALE